MIIISRSVQSILLARTSRLNYNEKVTSKRTTHELRSQGKISSEVMLVRLAEDKFYVVSYPEQDQCCWGEYVFGVNKPVKISQNGLDKARTRSKHLSWRLEFGRRWCKKDSESVWLNKQHLGLSLYQGWIDPEKNREMKVACLSWNKKSVFYGCDSGDWFQFSFKVK